MSKTKKHLEEELEALRKQKRLKTKSKDNEILGHIKKALKKMGYPDHPYNIGVAKEALSLFLGSFYHRMIEESESELYSFVEESLFIFGNDFKKKHELTPLWRAMKDDQ